ncbi:MAG: PAS domain S-box protein [Ignavibacteriae bacterium]|nr:PAS domain S-box protein [Ignavibacteriota bacterium]
MEVFNKRELFKNFENVNLDKNGNKIILSTTAFPMLDENGNLLGYRGVDLDITEKRKHDEIVLDSKNKLITLLNATTELAFLADKDGIFLEVNDALAKSLKRKKEELLGKSMFEFFQGEIAQKRAAKLQELLKTKKPIKWIDDRTGRYFDNSIYPILDDEGNVKQLAAFIIDITESRQTKKRLEEKTIVLDNLLMSATNIAIATTDLDLRINYYNPIAEKYFGYSVEEAIGKTVMEIHTKENVSHERLRQALEKVKQNGEYNYSLEQKTAEGVQYLESRVSGILDRGGKTIGYALFSQDITEQKQIEQSLKENEKLLSENLQRLNLHVEHTPLAVIEWDIDFKVSKWNKAAEKIFGYSEVEAIGKHVAGLIIPKEAKEAKEAKEEVDKVWDNLLENKGSDKNQNKNNKKNGDIIECEWYNTPLITTNGKVIGVASLVHDITEQKTTERDLKDSEAKFRLLSTNSQDNIWIADFEFNVTYTNDSIFNFLGYTPEEFYSKSISDYVLPEDLIILKNASKELFLKYENGEILQTILEIHHIKKDGTILDVEITANLLLDDSGQALGFQGRSDDITERKLAEKSLRDSEYLLKESQRVAQIGSYALDLTTGIWKSSEVLDEIFGLDKKFTRDVGGWLQIVHPADVTMMQQYFEKNVLTDHESFNKEYRINKHNDQRECWVHGLGELEFNNDGNPIRMIGTIQNITERKNDEIKILMQTKAIEQSPGTVVITDLDGNIEYVNNSFVETTGYTKEEAIGQNPRILKSGNLSKELYAELWETLLSGKTWRGEFLNKKKDSTLYWEDAIISPVKDDNNNTTNYIAIKTNITEIKLLQLKLKKYNVELEERVAKRTKQFIASEENYRTLAETMDEYICRLDNKQNITFMNSSLLNVLGKKKEDVIGSSLSSILKLFSTKENIKIVKNVIQKGKSTKLIEKVPWGEWVEWHLIFEDRKITEHGNIIIVGHDITKRKQLETKMKAALIKEKELNKLKTQFVSTVSHEFRTPLTSIYSSIELVERYGEKWDHSKKQDHFSRIKTSIEHLTNMLEEMLLLSRTESGKIEFHPESIDLSKFCDSVIKDSIPLLSKEQSFNYSYSLPKEEYSIDHNLLRVILTNLISNAIKYSPGENKIDIDVSGQKDKIKFTIKDNGMGISKEDMKHLFVPFYRSDEASTITGSGLGLSITKNYTELHKGIIKVKSNLGKGSTFTLIIPGIINN